MSKHIRTFIADTGHSKHRKAIWQILNDIDQDFVPPLSFRGSTTSMQLDCTHQQPNHYLKEYFSDILQQIVIMAQVAGEPAGILTFKHNYTIEILPEYAPCNYITTVGVLSTHRKIGVGWALYRFLFEQLPGEFQNGCWVTRTWLNNDSHIRLLDHFGFQIIKTFEDHRGKGVHTFYYGLIQS